jgi:HSP20 family protein
MFMPSVFGENDLMDDVFDDFDRDERALAKAGNRFFGQRNPLFGRHAKNLMKTDVRETDNSYELAVDLPGMKKDDVKLELKDGYLTISAEKSLDKDEKSKEGKMIRQERYAGAMQRSFYVGSDVTEDEVKAGFENGVLKISIPKKAEARKEEEHKYITIE